MSTGSKNIANLEEVNILDDKDQFLFYQNSTKKTKRITKGNMANSGGGLRGTFINATTNENVWGVADYARTTANAANISSSGAQASANGRNKIFYQADTPVASQFQGYIAATTLYADAISNTGGVPIRVGSILTGSGISAGTVVTAFGTGSGGAGTYTINNSQNVGSAGSKITITADPQFLEGDIWYETDNNYRTYRRSSSATWLSAFAPILTLDGSNKVSGFVRVSDINGSTATDEFAVVASKFQIWNGSSDEVPFTVDASSPAVTFTGSITGSVLTLNSNASGTLKLGTSLTGTGVAANTVIKTLLSGTIGQSGSTYFLSQITSPSVSSVSMTASYAGQVRITDALIQTLDAGKITSGFLSSQVIELPNSQSYIQSANFVETWTSGKQYVKDGERTQPSDQSKVKVLGNDGTYTVYKATVTHTSGATFAGDSANWTTSGVSQTLQGFRIVGNGQADFQDCTVLGTIRSSVGHFGSNVNAVKIDSSGLVIGTSGSIISAGVSWADGGVGSKGTFSGTGFFLGYTAGNATAYQFHIGNPSGNYLRWDGSVLKVNGNIVGGSTVGTTSTDVGLLMNTQYGIRRSVDDGTLTLTGGNGNGVYYGAQIDLVGSVFYLNNPGTGLAGDDGSGTLQLSAGYRTGSTYDGPLDGAIIFRTLREENDQDASNDNHSGAQRFRIELDGTVRVVYTGNAANNTDYGKVYYGTGAGVEAGLNTNPGRFLVEGSAADKHVQIKDGKIEFSSAANTYDVNLYRQAADNLGTDDNIVIGVSTNRYLYFYNTGGQIVWPSANGNWSGTSVNLYRGGGDLLKTDDDFEAVSVTSTSTKRVKKNIKTYKVGLKIVENLKPVSYKRKMNGQEDIGFIAEEVNEVLPVIVRKDDENIPQSMDYSKLTVVLVNAVKELSAEIKELKKKLKDANSN
jgi:hypothetical protein